MVDFGTRAMLDVSVSESSLSSAQSDIESSLDETGVRANVTPEMDNGLGGRGRRGSVGSGAGGGVLGFLNDQTEVLIQIRDAIEEQAFSQATAGGGGGGGGAGLGAVLRGGGSAAGGAAAGSAGGGILGGLGSGALGGAAGAAAGIGGSIGIGWLLQEQFGEFDPMELLKQQLSPEMSIANAFTGGLAGAGMGLGNILLEQSGDIGEALGLVENAEAFEQSLIEGVDRAFENARTKGIAFWTEDVPQAVDNIQWDTPQWVTDLTTLDFQAPQWLTDLTNPQITEPRWLSNLTNPQISEPGWVSDLQNLLGGGDNNRGRGGVGPTSGVGGSSGVGPIDVNVNGQGFERDLQRAVEGALTDSRQVERSIKRFIRDEVGV